MRTRLLRRHRESPRGRTQDLVHREGTPSAPWEARGGQGRAGRAGKGMHCGEFPAGKTEGKSKDSTEERKAPL